MPAIVATLTEKNKSGARCVPYGVKEPSIVLPQPGGPGGGRDGEEEEGEEEGIMRMDRGM